MNTSTILMNSFHVKTYIDIKNIKRIPPMIIRDTGVICGSTLVDAVRNGDNFCSISCPSYGIGILVEVLPKNTIRDITDDDLTVAMTLVASSIIHKICDITKSGT